MLGKVNVSVVNGQLQIDFNNYLYIKAEHWHYDTFITNKDITNIDFKWPDRSLINFNLNKSGKIEELEVWGEKFTKKTL